MEHLLLLLILGMVGGIVNSIAGGGGIILYPGLLAAGLNPLAANATASLVALSGATTSSIGARRQLKRIPPMYMWLAVPCLVGSAIGATILINTEPTLFEHIAPWLVLSAVLLLALQSRIHRWLETQKKRRKLHWRTMPLIYLSGFSLAIYGGFFGVGYGLMMLALLGFTTLTDIHQMNSVKNFCGAGMSLIATIYFAHAGLLDWRAGLIMAAGSAAGGFLGVYLAQKISAHLVHDATVAIGVIITIVLLVQS